MRKFMPVKDAPADTILPARSTEESGGYDFVLPCDVVIRPRGAAKVVLTNIKATMPSGEVLLLFIRSSVGIKRRVCLPNGVAVIDKDYFENPKNDGNIGISLINNSDRWQRFKKGDKVIQGLFVKTYKTDNDVPGGIRIGGIGSTGV